jgi:hypothetical protein
MSSGTKICGVTGTYFMSFDGGEASRVENGHAFRVSGKCMPGGGTS